jgi:hypothetical protein
MMWNAMYVCMYVYVHICRYMYVCTHAYVLAGKYAEFFRYCNVNVHLARADFLVVSANIGNRVTFST